MGEIQWRMSQLLPRLRRFALALTGEKGSACELAQDTAGGRHGSSAQGKRGTRPDSWMYRIAQNICVDHHRGRKAQGDQRQLDEIENLVGMDGRNITESRLTLAAVTESISRLPPEQQVLVAMVCVEGISYKEAANILGIPIGTVMSRLSRARQSLYATLTDAPTAADPVPIPFPGRERLR